MNVGPLLALMIIFIIIGLAFFFIYALNLNISAIQMIIIVGLIAFTLGIIGLYFLINKFLKEKQSEHIDLESKSYEFIMDWWKNKTGEILTYVDSKYQQRFLGQYFALWLFARREGGEYLGVVVGSKPRLHVAKWDWLVSKENLESLWEELAPIEPGYASEFSKPTDTIYTMKRAPIREKEVIEKEVHKTGWEELSEREKEKREKEKNE